MTDFISACRGKLPELLNFNWEETHWENASKYALRLRQWFENKTDLYPNLPPKNPSGTPVLLNDLELDSGCFGWLEITSNVHPRNETEEACDEVLQLLNLKLGYGQQHLRSKISYPKKSLAGTSAALPAVIEWIQQEFGISSTSDTRSSWGRCISTGGWNSAKQKLTPVSEAGLSIKIETAISKGYETLFLVEGQAIPEHRAEDFTIILVSSDPTLAVFEILESAPAKEALSLEPHKLESLFLAIRKRFLLAKDRYQTSLPGLVDHIQAVAKKSPHSNLNPIYCMATAIKAGKRLFHGDPNALDDMEEVHRILPDTKFTHSESCTWFRTEWLPYTGEALVDNFQWEDPEWSSYRESKERWNNFVEPWDTAGLFESMKAENQESFRYMFAARIEPDSRKAKDLLKKTIDSRLRYQDDWNSIFSLHHQRGDTSPGRQANLLAETLWTQRLLEFRFQSENGELDEIGKQVLPALEKLGLEQNNSFDRLANWTLAYWKGDISTIDGLTSELFETRHEVDKLESADSWLAERIYFTATDQSEKIRQLLDPVNLQEESFKDSLIRKLLRRRRQGLWILDQNQELAPDPNLPTPFNKIQNPRDFFLACPY
jgi:hypothetical protein